MTVNITVAADDVETSAIFSQAIAEFLVGKGCINVVDTGTGNDYTQGTNTSTFVGNEHSVIEQAHAQRDGAVPTLLDTIMKTDPNFMIDQDIRVTPVVHSQIDLDIAKLKERTDLLYGYRVGTVKAVEEVQHRLKNLVDWSREN